MRRAGGMEIDCTTHNDMSSIYIDVMYRGQGVRRKEKEKEMKNKDTVFIHKRNKSLFSKSQLMLNLFP